MNIDILPLNSEMELNEAFESSVNHILKCSRWKLTLKAEKKKGENMLVGVTGLQCLQTTASDGFFFLPTDENFLGHLADSFKNCVGVI